ncbi:MAG: right-handed parallel beta-helix repeat-containing protein [Thermodesulfovibrionales bacterium]
MKTLYLIFSLLIISFVLGIASLEAATEITSLPYTINSSGSYYITKDLSSTNHGIIVNKNHVTIDLMGHSIKGSSSGGYHGIYINGRTNVEIKNGTIRNFGLNGIYEESNSGNSHRIINVRVIGNKGSGIYLNGYNNLVQSCTVSYNYEHGIAIYLSSTITGNTVNSNGFSGINTYIGCTIMGNIVNANNSFGIYNYGGSTIISNTVCGNGWDGIFIEEGGSTVKNNTVDLNGDYGIYFGLSFCLVDGNTAGMNDQSGLGYPDISDCLTCTFGFNSYVLGP